MSDSREDKAGKADHICPNDRPVGRKAVQVNRWVISRWLGGCFVMNAGCRLSRMERLPTEYYDHAKPVGSDELLMSKALAATLLSQPNWRVA